MNAPIATETRRPASLQGLVGRFNPSLREIRAGIWQASTSLPVVGEVSVTARSWEEARLSLWLIYKAVEMLARKQCKPPSEWTEDEWKRTLGTMFDVMSPKSRNK